jgi:hypothetical protein
MTRIFSLLTVALVAASLTWSVQVATAQAPGQQTFASAGAAAQALAYAVQGDDRPALTGMLGRDTNLVASGDDSLDQADRRLFLEKYQQMHRLTKEADGDVVLFIGAENWPFPVPLASAGGRWYFDEKAGKDEVITRRIGQNEIEAMQTSLALVGADQDHAPGLVSPTPSHGYYYRVLDSRSALIAYPAAYRSSGVMTFLVTRDGVVYQRDLGPHTKDIAAAIQQYDRSRSWQRVE